MIANSNNLSSSFIQISKETRLELLSLGLESSPDLVGLHIGAKVFCSQISFLNQDNIMQVG